MTLNRTLTVEWDGGKKVYEVSSDPTESEVWKLIAENLVGMKVPNTIVATLDGDTAKLNVIKRGTFVKKGVKLPSPYVTCTHNDLTWLKPSDYPEKYLTCINPESGVYGNYKFYRFEPGPLVINAEYGRIGAERGEMYAPKTTSFDKFLFWIRYYEKLSKGYTDQSEIYLGELAKAKEMSAEQVKEEVKDTFVPGKTDAELYAMLKAYAKNVVENSLISLHITQKQIDESRKVWNKLGKVKTVKTFNKRLMELMTICPRKTISVKGMLAESVDDFPDIIDREESLILAMEAMVDTGNNGKTIVKSTTECFETMGISVREPSPEEKDKVMNLLLPDHRKSVEAIYMVNSERQDKIFEKYCEDRKINERQWLLHGSRNCNWLSIIKNSLLLNPNAQITGKGLGYGIYFGNSVIKCSHYTFGNRADKMLIGVFEVAYGKPLRLNDTGHYMYSNHTQEELDSKGMNCVHYQRKGCDWADEIVVYNESALAVRALIVMKQ